MKVSFFQKFNLIGLLFLLGAHEVRAGLAYFNISGTGTHGSIAYGQFSVDEVVLTQPGYNTQGGVSISLTISNSAGGNGIVFGVDDLIIYSVFSVDSNGLAFLLPVGSHNDDSAAVYTLSGGDQFNESVFSFNAVYSDTITWAYPTRIPPPSPPTLSIQPNGTNVTLSWPTSAAGFVLEESSGLKTPDGFSSVTNDVGSVDGKFSVTLPLAANGQRFYRLRSSSP